MDYIHKGPGFYVGVIGYNSDISEDSKYSNVLPYWFGTHGVQDVGCTVITGFSPKSSYRPFHEKEWNTHQEKTNQVRNNKGTASILYCLNGKSQEITQTYCISCHGKYQSGSGPPRINCFSH